MSGIYFTTSGEENEIWRIVNIIENSPAAKAGLQRADEILSIDGIPAGKYSMESLKRFFQKEGREITVRVRRERKILSFSMRLERLI